ncbi:hypothetical protein [Vreelandella alkaliphila]|uniref:Phage tail tape measure protein n=1 Tax=Vreelandella alkaliphila TaxID=272774 RepID=A0ABX4HLC8_9GAMM|nr:hypothetical protein [Halomonas humidisoli]PAU73286.1 hypothetical protein CK497_01395 [Halomonas humidisoli]
MARNLNLSVTLQAINKATGPLRQIMEGSRGAGGAIRETRDHLRNLQDQQKKLTAFRDMSRQSHGTRRALMDKREELKRITQELESTTGPTRRLTQQQERAQREVEKLSGEYRQNRDRVRELARELPAGVEGVRGFTQQQDALAKQIEETNHRLGRQQDALRRLGEANVGGRFNAMTGEIRRFGRNVTVAGGIAAGSIFALSSSTASLGDDVAKTADKMGIGTTELQQLHYAAERAGVGTEGLNSSMQRMVRRIGRAANGTGAAVKPLEQLGLSAQELNNMRPEQAVAAIADALESVESHGDKIAIMSGIMGNSGESMINMLRGGSEELEALMAAGLETGYVLSEESARGAENFQDALLDAQLAVKGVKNTIGAELMPAVTDIMREFVGWMRENREQVQAFAKAFGERLKNAVPIIIDLATGAAGMASSIADIVSRTAELVGGFDNLAMIVGGLFAAKMILSIVMFGVSLVKAGGAIIALAKTLPALGIGIKAIGALMMATPIGWLIAGIAAIAGAAYLIYKYWEPIKAFFIGLWQQVKAAFDEGIDGVARLLINWSPLGLIHSAFIGALDLLGISVPVGFRDLGSFVIDGLIGGLNDKLNALRERVSGIASSIMDWFKGVLGINSPSRVFEGFGTNIVEGIINGIGGMAGALRDHVTSLASDIAGWMSNAVGSAVDVGRDIANGLGDGIANATGRVQGAIRWMTGSAEEEAREDLDTHSPSRVFRSIGIDVSAGLANGIKDDADGPLKQVRSLTNSLRSAAGGLMLSAGIASPAAALDIPQPEAQTVTANIAAQELPSVDRNNIDTSSVQIDARPPLQSHANASQSGGLVIQGGINIQVHAAPGMDEQALARLVNEQVQRALEQAERRAAAASRRNFYDND